MTNALLCGFVGFAIFSTAWAWYYLKPAFNKATGVAVYRSVLWQNPLYWSLGMTVALACASLYLALA
jgi:hypothetical protein